jgi:uncharacterized protein
MTAFNVSGLLHDPPGAVREYRLQDRYVSLAPEVELAGPLNGRLRMQRTNRGILVRGSVDAQVRRTCGRCLEAYVEPAHIEISEEYLPSVDLGTGGVVPPPAEGEGTQVIDEHHEIDLTQVLRDEFALTEPMHPLCRPDCAGLCAECGEALGSRHVPHHRDEIDPRLAGLARFLDRNEH